MVFPNLSAWALKAQSLVLFLMIVLGGAGAVTYTNLGRAEDPTFTIKTMVIQVLWPGATAEEVERLITDRIEKTLQEIKHFDYASSYSKPGLTVITVNLEDTTPPGAVKDTWYEVRKSVGDIAPTLPAGVVGPFFNDEFGDSYGTIYALHGDGFTMANLEDSAEDIRQRLLAIPDVAKVELIGVQNQQIEVVFSHRHITALGLTPQDVVAVLQRQNEVIPAGAAETKTDRVQLRVSGDLDGVAAIKAVPIVAEGRLLRLSDFSDVSRGYVDPQDVAMRHRGEPVLGLAISMVDGGNILDLGQALDAELSDIRDNLPLGIEIEKIADQPKVVEKSVGEFVKKLVIALSIVLIVSFLSLGIRTGIVVALAVPLTLGITFLLIAPMGIGLQRISLGALIISLGLLVDDAIIAVEMMVVKMEQGWSREDAASAAWDETAMPMLSGTLITAAGFIPVGFAASTAGEYAGSIFWVVGTALIVSWIVAVIFTPYLGAKLLPSFENHQGKGEGSLLKAFRRIVITCLRARWLVIVATLALLATSFIAMTQVERQFFPSSSRPEVLIDVTLAEGSTFEATQTVVRRIEKDLSQMEDVLDYTVWVGEGAPRFYLPLDPVLPRPNFAQFLVMTKDAATSEIVAAKLRTRVTEEYTEVRARVSRLENGPPVGYPIQFRVLGSELEKVREVAAQVQQIIAADPAARDAHVDWGERTKMLQIEVDQERARLAGLSSQDVRQTLATVMTGLPVTQFREGTDLIDVLIRAVPEERAALNELPEIVIRNSHGENIPLAQIAAISYGQEEGIIWRRSRDIVMTARADIQSDEQPATVAARMESLLNELALPPGIRIETGGAVEESKKGEASIIALMPVLGLVIATLLMIQLNSFSKMFLVLATAPLGIVGVAWTLFLFDVPLGFVSILGVIALAGMIIRNSVILVDQIDQDIGAGQNSWDAIVDSTVRRARPIVLTALAAVFAFIPLTHSDFWGPMAYAIIGGLSVATMLTLLFVPALYAAWFHVLDPRANQAPRRPGTP